MTRWYVLLLFGWIGAGPMASYADHVLIKPVVKQKTSFGVWGSHMDKSGENESWSFATGVPDVRRLELDVKVAGEPRTEAVVSKPLKILDGEMVEVSYHTILKEGFAKVTVLFVPKSDEKAKVLWTKETPSIGRKSAEVEAPGDGEIKLLLELQDYLGTSTGKFEIPRDE